MPQGWKSACRQHWSTPPRDSAGWGRHRGGTELSHGSSSSARTTVRALAAAGAYLAHDLCDPDGVVRPRLRQAALRLASGSSQSGCSLARTYLRLDPPKRDESLENSGVIDAGAPSLPAQVLPAERDPSASSHSVGTLR